jgi:hypothetical protein
MLDLQPSAAQMLEERISDARLNAKTNAASRALIIELAAVAVPAVLSAGAGGNVTCRTAALKLLKLLEKK